MSTDKLTFAPISITLYDENDEPKATFERSVLRWGILKKAMKIAKAMDTEKNALDDETLDMVSAFVCELFQNQFTREALEAGADIPEVMTVFREVVKRAGSLGNA